MLTRPSVGDEVIWEGYRYYVQWIDGNTVCLEQVMPEDSLSNVDVRITNISEIELA